jgi:hypothetical protein
MPTASVGGGTTTGTVSSDENTAHTDPAAHMNTMSTPRPPKPGRSLANRFPYIATQWHPTRNGDLTPDRVTAGSEIRVWWRCEQGHEWETAVILRIYGSFGCPVCAERFTRLG